MKIEVPDPIDRTKWMPVKIEMTLDTVKEARLLFHCFNCLHLWDALVSHGYSISNYSSDVSKDFDPKAFEVIQKIIEDQGFEV